MKLFLTGSNGFLGQSIIERSYFNNEFVTVSRSQKTSETKHYAMDITDQRIVYVLQDNDPEAVIHCAAKSIVRDCENNPGGAFLQNIQGTVNILEGVRKLGKDIPVVVLETDKVYGQQPDENIPTREEHPLLGFSPYETSKVMTSQICDFYRNYYGLRIYSLRPANIFGPLDKNLSRIIPGTFNKLSKEQAPTIYSDSINQYREYLFVDDLVDIIDILIRERPEAGAYNISSGTVLNPAEVIKACIAVSGVNIQPTIVNKDTPFQEISKQALDGSKLAAALGHNMPILTPFKEALTITWEEHGFR